MCIRDRINAWPFAKGNASKNPMHDAVSISIFAEISFNAILQKIQSKSFTKSNLTVQLLPMVDLHHI